VKDTRGFAITFSEAPRATDWVDGEGFPKLKLDVHTSGGTALHDALYVACHDRFLKAASDALQRRVLILLTDGEDDASRMSFRQLLPYVQEAAAVVFAISTGGRRTPVRGRKTLQTLATATGGQAFFPETPDEIPSVFAAINEELEAMQYITYVPAEIEVGKYHEVKLTVGDRMRIRAPEGYLAEKKSVR
jgi:VWFA-related protein